jgi:hypothetical protein
VPSNQQVNSDYKVVVPPSPPAFTPEWALFKFLDKWEPSDMEIAVRKNIQVDFSGYMGSVVDYTIAEILKKFETYRPDLHKVLASASGKLWLKKQILKALTPK